LENYEPKVLKSTIMIFATVAYRLYFDSGSSRRLEVRLEWPGNLTSKLSFRAFDPLRPFPRHVASVVVFSVEQGTVTPTIAAGREKSLYTP